MSKFQDHLFTFMMIVFSIYLVVGLFIQFKVVYNNEPIVIYKNSTELESEKVADYLNKWYRENKCTSNTVFFKTKEYTYSPNVIWCNQRQTESIYIEKVLK